MKLKTLKDIVTTGIIHADRTIIYPEDIREEAIRWIKKHKKEMKELNEEKLYDLKEKMFLLGWNTGLIYFLDLPEKKRILNTTRKIIKDLREGKGTIILDKVEDTTNAKPKSLLPK